MRGYRKAHVRRPSRRSPGRRRGLTRCGKATVLAVAVGALGCAVALLPAGAHLEEEFGLSVLFRLRGPAASPPDVVIVSVDKASVERLAGADDPARWSRALHARVVDALARGGAAVIAFDLFFEEPRRPKDDDALAGAIRRAGNVVLAAYLMPTSQPLGGGGRARVERIVPPAEPFAGAALGWAPFPLPRVPVRMNQYWAFKTSAGGTPTLPVVALQAFALDAYEDLLRALELAGLATTVPRLAGSPPAAGGGALHDVVMAVRGALEADAAAGARVREQAGALSASTHDPRRARLLRALVTAYLGPDSRYLNFYGPRGTIGTIPYHRAVDPAEAPRFAGKAVFVGISEALRPEIRDAFYTPFSREGADFSGVELAATALANLLDDRAVRPLVPAAHLGVVVGAGVLLGALCTLLAPALAAGATLLAAGAYLAAASWAFEASALWYPLVVPLALQAPAAFVTATLWRYADARRERDRVREAFSYYLPGDVIDRLVTGMKAPAAGAQPVYGVCLATDAGRYTTLAESLDPTDLARLMNDYYAAVFEPIRRHGGFVSDVVGDSALAIWAAAEPDAGLRARACLAACELSEAVDRFNRASAHGALTTRVGLHSGTIVLGHVGAMDHYEYRAVGDIVNTATRIEGLNKRLGTRILVSDEVARSLDGFLTRRLGTFLLAGKTRSIVVHELVCRREEASPQQVEAAGRFAEALALYEAGRLSPAERLFEALARERSDAAAAYYARRCERWRTGPPGEPWTVVVRMEDK